MSEGLHPDTGASAAPLAAAMLHTPGLSGFCITDARYTQSIDAALSLLFLLCIRPFAVATRGSINPPIRYIYFS